jgi:hypothetical protein
MNGVMSTLLRLPLLHRVLSSMMLLIRFTGRKSGTRYTTPVGYFREGSTVIILTKRFRKWWRNFEQPAPVELLIKRRWQRGQAIALTDTETIIPIITHLMAAHPREAQIYEVAILENGQPDPASVRELAPKVVVIRVTLDTK